MPTSTAAVASSNVARGCQLGLIQWLSSHQRKTVAAEPQLPGPGRRRPVPKKVATSLAQSAAGGRDAPVTPALPGFGGCFSWVMFVPLEFLVRIERRAFFDSFGDVVHRRRDHIRAAGPLSKIDRAAVIAAEREFRVSALHRFLADWAPQVQSASHRSLDDLRHQIVVMSFG